MTVWDPDGPGPLPPVVVVGGSFTVAGSVVANNIAAWNPATGQWSALGVGTNSTVRALSILPSGELVVGGEFTAAGSVIAQHVALWNGARWSRLGAGFAGERTRTRGSTRWRNRRWRKHCQRYWRSQRVVRDLASRMGPARRGDHRQHGRRFRRVHRRTAGWRTHRRGDVFGNRRLSFWEHRPLDRAWMGHDRRRHERNCVHGGGNADRRDHRWWRFSTAGNSVANRVARWIGTGWNAVGTNLTGPVRSLKILPHGDIAAAGAISRTTPGEIGTASVGIWNGAVWATPAAGPVGVAYASAVLPRWNLLRWWSTKNCERAGLRQRRSLERLDLVGHARYHE